MHRIGNGFATSKHIWQELEMFLAVTAGEKDDSDIWWIEGRSAAK